MLLRLVGLRSRVRQRVPASLVLGHPDGARSADADRRLASSSSSYGSPTKVRRRHKAKVALEAQKRIDVVAESGGLDRQALPKESLPKRQYKQPRIEQRKPQQQHQQLLQPQPQPQPQPRRSGTRTAGLDKPRARAPASDFAQLSWRQRQSPGWANLSAVMEMGERNVNDTVGAEAVQWTVASCQAVLGDIEHERWLEASAGAKKVFRGIERRRAAVPVKSSGNGNWAGGSDGTFELLLRKPELAALQQLLRSLRATVEGESPTPGRVPNARALHVHMSISPLLAEFPFDLVFRNMIRVGWWGGTDEIVRIVEVHLCASSAASTTALGARGSSSSSSSSSSGSSSRNFGSGAGVPGSAAERLAAFNKQRLRLYDRNASKLNATDVLTGMLKACCEVGWSSPFDKDAVRVALRLLDVLRVRETAQEALPYFFRERTEGTGKYNMVMRLLLRQFDAHQERSMLERVLQLNEEVSARGCYPTVSTHCHLLHCYGRLGRLDRVFEYLAELQNDDVPPHRSIARAVLAVCAHNGDADRAELVLDSMRERSPWAAGEFFRRSWLAVAKHQLAGVNADGLVEDPTRYMGKNLGGGGIGSSSSAGSVGGFNLGKSGGNGNRAWMAAPPALGKRADRSWPAPTAAVYNILLKLHADKGDLDKVNGLYVDMRARKVPTDLATASILALAFEGSPYGETLLKLERPELVPEPDAFMRPGGGGGGSPDADPRRGVFEGWLKTDRPGFFLDLHTVTKAQARIAVLAHMRAIGNAVVERDRRLAALGPVAGSLSDAGEDREERNPERIAGREAAMEPRSRAVAREDLDDAQLFIVIAGKGLGDRSSGKRGPVLNDLVLNLLDDHRIAYWLQRNNRGRINVAIDDLGTYVRNASFADANQRNDSLKVAAGMVAASSVCVVPFVATILSDIV